MFSLRRCPCPSSFVCFLSTHSQGAPHRDEAAANLPRARDSGGAPQALPTDQPTAAREALRIRRLPAPGTRPRALHTAACARQPACAGLRPVRCFGQWRGRGRIKTGRTGGRGRGWLRFRTAMHCTARIGSASHLSDDRSSMRCCCSCIFLSCQNHSGGLSGGHYTSFCLHAETRKWYLFDDSRVTPVADANSVRTSAAYCLFYKRRA